MATLHLMAEQADLAALILMALISEIFSEIFSEISSEVGDPEAAQGQALQRELTLEQASG